MIRERTRFGILLYDLTEQRIRSLQRVNESIEEMTQVILEMSSDSPNRYLAEGILKSLRSTKARLEGGLPGRRASRN